MEPLIPDFLKLILNFKSKRSRINIIKIEYDSIDQITQCEIKSTKIKVMYSFTVDFRNQLPTHSCPSFRINDKRIKYVLSR